MMSIACLTCHTRVARCRGNCSQCRRRHAAAVHRGETTWEELEKKGLTRPPQRVGMAWMKGFRHKDS